ncbi:hypothetical protein [Amycolatopsis saalfeldensis]|uniref:SPW repeat-containing protein n=1 Tax=Amycolatopsis saalfeldensis TaxID=394193 RepID=A0A1H8YJF6_9PSEU|nr:hypothetical protein [Amycolatopsis saalfeldensis]SEP52286.1 hypothetical protein SAMN04489732_119168 [Amycolatopsis saalfeldensis]
MFRRLDRNTLISFAGLLVGILGLLIQWAADPAKFANGEKSVGFSAFPPGILFILGAGLLMLATARWWWHPVFGVLIAFWIVVVGGLSNQLTPNLFSSNPGTVAGNVVMVVGLATAGIAGVIGMVKTRRAKPVASAR